MAYGAELTDSNGRRFARIDGGECYHYWGKVTIPNLHPGWQEVPLFYIPSSVPVGAFIFCDFGGNEDWRSRYGKAEIRIRDGYWVARAFRTNAGDVQASFTSATFYIFVPARYIRPLAYGLQCFDESSTKVYDSSRPMLQIAGLGAGGTLTTGSASYFNRTPAKTAAAYCATSASQFMTVNGTAYWAVLNYYGTTTNGNLAGYTGVISMLALGGTAPPSSQFSNIPLIDAGYYDLFPNLGNF